MRLISTDFDGVFHPVSAIHGLTPDAFHAARGTVIAERGLFRWCVMLERLLDGHPDVNLAVHSSWRQYLNNPQLREVLGSSLARRFIGIAALDLPRQEGIEEFADRAGAEHVLVVDDDPRSFKDFAPLVLTDPELGLSDYGVHQRISAWLQTSR